MRPPFSAILFDLDGLIIDSEAVASRVWKKLCLEQGFHLSDASYLRGVGAGVSRFIEELSKEFGAGFDTELVRRRRPVVWEEVLETDGLERKPGFDELLEFLEEQSIPRAIATTTERRLVEQRLRASAVDPKRFHAVVCGDEVAAVKPAPDVYLKAAELVGAAPGGCLVLEDSNTGAEAASRAGMPYIVVPDLLPPSETTRKNALKICPDLSHVRFFLASAAAEDPA